MAVLAVLVLSLIGIGYFISFFYSLYHYMSLEFPAVVVTPEVLTGDTYFPTELRAEFNIREGDQLDKRHFSFCFYINERKKNLIKIIIKRSIFYWVRFSIIIIAFSILSVIMIITL